MLFILSWVRFVTMLLILQLDQWPNKVETKTATLFVPVYQYPSHPPLPSSDLCHNLSAYSHTPAPIYISWITSGPCCTLGTLLHFLTGPSMQLHSSLVSLGCCLFSACLIPSLCLSVSPASCPFIFFSFLNPTLSLSPNLLCLHVPEFTLHSVLKDGFAHICSAKSSHPSGTDCSYELCQPSPIRLMNHFLLTFL